MDTEEKWRDVRNFEGLYQVSNLGRVKTLRQHYPEGKLLSIRQQRRESPSVILRRKDGTAVLVAVKLLVAQSFLNVSDTCRTHQVRQKDGDRNNCNAKNLYV